MYLLIYLFSKCIEVEDKTEKYKRKKKKNK